MNSFKFGLTGQGVVLAHEAAEEFDENVRTLEAEMGPRSALARKLIHRIALTLLKLKRGAEHEAASIRHAMLHATRRYYDDRRAEFDGHMAQIGSDPGFHARCLRESPEGADMMIRAFEGILKMLRSPDATDWGWHTGDLLLNLMGEEQASRPVSRCHALIKASFCSFNHLEPEDGPGLDDDARRKWAIAALAELVEAELVKLKAEFAAMDLDALRKDRDEAPMRAMFDASKAAVLARKYDAANERSLFRTLKEFREVQAETPEVDEAREVTPESSEELGSFFPEASEEVVEEADADPTEAGGGGGSPQVAQTPGLNRRARRKRLAEARSKRR